MSKIKPDLSLPTNPTPQNPGAPESHHSPRSQRHIFPGLGISASTFLFILHTEFPKPGDQHILTGCYGSLHDFHKGFGDLNGFGLREAESVMDTVNDVGFCEGHGEGSCFGFWVSIALSGWFVKGFGKYRDRFWAH